MSGFNESPLRGRAVSRRKIEDLLEQQKGGNVLDLADSFIGDEGCETVSQFVRANPSFQSIQLNGNNIGVEGIR
jgi:hypothetical protein